VGPQSASVPQPHRLRATSQIGRAGVVHADLFVAEHSTHSPVCGPDATHAGCVAAQRSVAELP
jgi:hypothetical protein